MEIALAAGGLLLLALAHSMLGEQGFVRPLLAADWTLAEVPRPEADRLTRGAWHLTSIAWVGLAAVALGLDPLVAVGLVAVGSGLLLGAFLPPHFAWPLFLVSGFASLRAADALPSWLLTAVVVVAAVALVAAGVLHVYWAFGGRWGMDVAVPSGPEGTPAFVPGTLLTLAVAGLLFGYAGLLGARLVGFDHLVVVGGTAVGVAVLALRAIGDGGQAGFSKRDRSTAFARADDRYFTPLVTLLAFGGAAALLV